MRGELCGSWPPLQYHQPNSYELTSPLSSEARDAHRFHLSSLPLHISFAWHAVHLLFVCRSSPGLWQDLPSALSRRWVTRFKPITSGLFPSPHSSLLSLCRSPIDILGVNMLLFQRDYSRHVNKDICSNTQTHWIMFCFDNYQLIVLYSIACLLK